MRPRGRLLAAGALSAVSATLAGSTAAADSFAPVRLQIKVAPTARRGVRLPITVAIGADAGALDAATTRLRIRVKLAGECGGAFGSTPGTVLLDRPLSPAPTVGQAYTTTMRGSGPPRTYGAMTVCTYLEEPGDGREFATDQSAHVDVSRPCTVLARSYDAARAALKGARRHRHGVAAASRRVSRDHRTAARACGAGVAL